MNAFSDIKKSLVLVFVLMGISTFQDNAYAGPCTKKDKEYAEALGNYYEPEEAHSFGLKIEGLIRDQNLKGLLQLIKGELINGPRKNFVKEKSFNAVFPKKWVDAVLAGSQICSPVGFRGFMLGNGMLWYNKIDGQWQIIAINGAHSEPKRIDQVGWTVNGRMLHPECFVREWLSSDNFKALVDHFKIPDRGKFSVSPGLFLGKEITNFSPIVPSWCESKDCDKVPLVRTVETCAPSKFAYENRDGVVFLKEEEPDTGYRVEHVYSVLGAVSVDNCAKLAPNLTAKCLSSFLVEVGDYSGGSMGYDMRYGIFGIFDLGSMGLSVVPLRYFRNRNDGLNYLDEQESVTNSR